MLDDLRTSRPRRAMQPSILALLCLLFVQTPLLAQFTGSWAGTYQNRDCGKSNGGQAAVSMLQSGTSVTGVVSAEQKIDGETCQPLSPSVTLELPLSGTASGNSLSGTFIGPPVHAISFTATLSGSTLTLQGIGPDSDLTATMTQTSSAAPNTAASGSYSGTYTATNQSRQCLNIPNHTYSGPLSGSLTQAGNKLAGVLVASEVKETSQPDPSGNCTEVAQPDAAIQIMAEISGTSVSGFIFGDNLAPFSGTLNGGTLTISGGDARDYFTFTVSRSTTPLAPVIASFGANPSTIPAGSNTTLSWVTINATAVSIDSGVGSLPASGSTVVQPTATTTYTLTTTGPGGSATAKTTVTVSPIQPTPDVVVTAFPIGMLQATGSPLPTDRFTLTNLGGTQTIVNLSKTGTFFTQTPTSFTLVPGSSQVVLISASQQPAGKYEGSTTVSGNGFASINVPIVLVVGDAPSSPVTITVPITRSDLTAPLGQNPASAVSFTNPGSSTIQGIVVAEAPWIVVPSPGLTLGPGETKQVQFSIDRTKRPDAASGVIGGVTGSITFRYINTATGKITVLDTTITSNVSVSIVDVVTLNAATGAPPALASGELAFFITGASSKFGFGDLALSSGSTANVADFKMYFAQAGATASQVSSIGQFLSNSGISFPNVVKNIFNAPSATGALQLRSAQLGQISVAQNETRSTVGQSYVTALPVFRSDRGFASGAEIFLPGVQKTSTLTTNIYLQEMSGNNATVTTDFFDVDGNNRGTRTDTLTPFGSMELQNAVPVSAVTARVRNTTSGTTSINAYALVIDAFTNDAFSVVQIDPVTDPMFCPAFAAGSGSRDVFLNLTNASTSPITVTATTVSRGPRRRAVSNSFAPSLASAPSTLTIPPLAYRQVKIADTGFVRLTGSTALRVAGTFSVSRSGGTIGSGLTVLPTSRALSGSGSRRFAGIEDASPSVVAAARPSTYRSNLMLVETAGLPVTVRLTLRYVFSAGVTVSASAISSRDFEVPAGSFTLISEIGSAIIGAQRANYDSLHNAILDVQVIGGSGSVIPFLQVIDNGTGDVTVRD